MDHEGIRDPLHLQDLIKGIGAFIFSNNPHIAEAHSNHGFETGINGMVRVRVLTNVADQTRLNLGYLFSGNLTGCGNMNCRPVLSLFIRNLFDEWGRPINAQAGLPFLLPLHTVCFRPLVIRVTELQIIH